MVSSRLPSLNHLRRMCPNRADVELEWWEKQTREELASDLVLFNGGSVAACKRSLRRRLARIEEMRGALWSARAA